MPDGPERHPHENAVEQTINSIVNMLCGVLELFARLIARIQQYRASQQNFRKNERRGVLMELRAVLFLRLNASSNCCEVSTSSREEVRFTQNLMN